MSRDAAECHGRPQSRAFPCRNPRLPTRYPKHVIWRDGVGRLCISPEMSRDLTGTRQKIPWERFVGTREVPWDAMGCPSEPRGAMDINMTRVGVRVTARFRTLGHGTWK